MSSLSIMNIVMNDLLTSATYDCFLEYGKMSHHLKTIRCDFPIQEETHLIEKKGTQFNGGVIQINNIRTQHYPNGRITDLTDLRPTRPTYIADIVLYTRRPYIHIPTSLDPRFKH
ncbi:MAG: hypothetical protein PHG66_00620 [Candidatus Colwellbacteria bacterium]|nr:hypothetical protein [Candidatus Colwellbacteria bacterium]